ncbi:DUF6049 family protein [Leucobacter sp. W1478]|uniref:DUF6049 family protein n=1 Tax=Leucobacter sp. W1478 TaxID=3439065 RepID=UPI003F2B4818
MSRAPHQRSRRRLASRRSLARACTAALLTAVLTLSAATATAAAAEVSGSARSPEFPARTTTPATTETPAPGPEDPESDTQGVTAEIIVAPASPVLEAEADEHQFTVHLRNTGKEAIPAGEVRLLLNTTPLESTTQLATVEPSARATQIALTAVGETASGSEQNLTFAVPRDTLPLSFASAAGVYSVHVELRLPAFEPLETRADPLLVSEATPFVWQDAGTDARVPVTLVVPFTLPGNVRTVPSADQLREVAPRLTSLLDEAERAEATLAVDPRIIAGIRVLGDDAPASAQALLERFESTTQPLFLLQFADADPAAQAALGLDELLRPLGFGYLLGNTDETDVADAETNQQNPLEGAEDAGSEDASAPASGEEESLTNSSDQTPGVDPPNGLVATPEVDQLAGTPGAYLGAWPASGGVDGSTLDLLRGAGITNIVLDSGNVADATGTRVLIDGMSALVADATLTDSTKLTLAGESPSERASGIADLTAFLALSALQGTAGLVLAVDRGALADAENPAGLLATVSGLGWVNTVPEMIQPEGTGTIRSGKTAEQRLELLRATVARSDEIDAVAPVLRRPQSLVEYQRLRLLEAFATRYAGADVDFDAVDDRIRARDAELLSGVRVVGTENTQLVGTSSRVPVTLHNALPFDANVMVKVSPTSAGIAVPVRAFPNQVVSADGNHVVLVGVKTRISSGESGLRVEVHGNTSEQALSERVLKLTIRSSYETILLVSLAATATLLLALGIWRSLRRHAASNAVGPDAEQRTVDQSGDDSPGVHLPRE